MLDNIWRTIGLGTPTNIRQMFARGVWCLCLAAIWFAVGASGTFLGWLFVVILSVIAGGWFTYMWTIVSRVLDEHAAEENTPTAVEQELILDPDRDYVVNTGAPIWMTVGNSSIQIVQKENGVAQVNAYPLYREDEPATATFEV